MLIERKKMLHLPKKDLSKFIAQIGATPIQPIQIVIDGIARKVCLKLEYANPTGSMKDRTGYALIQYLEDQGVLNEQSVIIESTSGNLGAALSFQCKARGYGFIAIIDPKTTRENIAKMEAFGAQIELVHDSDAMGGYLLSRLERVRELCSCHSNYIWTDQYSSPANPYIHYSSTAPEIYRQMNERVDVVFVPVSTGGTLAGIGRFFREVSPSTRIVGVDVLGSVIFWMPPAPRKLTGIGSSRHSNFITRNLYDEHIIVTDEEAFAFCHELYRATDIKVGGSSGAVLAACAKYLFKHTSIKNTVCICADDGENYESSIYSDEWIQRQNLHFSKKHLGAMEKFII